MGKLFPDSLLAMNAFKMKREIRDPIYGYVHVNEFENEIIDTDEFQRLGRIFQMPTAMYVYPSASHTRKSHSLGVMYLAHKALLRILYRQSLPIRKKISPLFFEPFVLESSDKQQYDSLDQQLGNKWWDKKSPIETVECMRLAALLHDIGHAPFCHLFEDICSELSKDDASFQFSHEKMGIEIIKEKLASKFKSPFSTNDIIQVLSKNSNVPSFLHELIDGPYDVDKLDYLLRDSYHAGTREYGSIDFERIIDGFRVKDLRLLISKSAIGALMNSFSAVQYMYTNVYYHKTSRIIDHMISDALKLIPGFIRNIASDVNEFLKYDDFNFITEIKNNRTNSGDDDFKKAYGILKDVLNRKKSYALIFPYNLTLGIARDKSEELQKLKKDLEEMAEAEGLKVKIDFRARIRPVGIDFERLLEWLTHDNIFDEDDPISPTKNLEDVSKAYFKGLTRYQILFYIFVDRTQKDSGRFEYQINKIKSEAEQKLQELEKIEALG